MFLVLEAPNLSLNTLYSSKIHPELRVLLELQNNLCFGIDSQTTSFIWGFYCLGYSQCFTQSENVLETVFSQRKNADHQPLAVSLILIEPVSQTCAGLRWFLCLYGSLLQGCVLQTNPEGLVTSAVVQYALLNFFQAYSIIAFPWANSGTSY